MRYATLVRDELIGLDPKNKAVLEQNAAQFLKKLEALDQAIKEATQTIPPNNRRLLTYHDSWPYFARRYGFQVIGAVQPSDFADPSPREVVRLIEQIKEKGPGCLGRSFSQPGVGTDRPRGKSRYIDKLRDDKLPGKPGDPQHSYIGTIVENITIMFEALGGLNGSVEEDRSRARGGSARRLPEKGLEAVQASNASVAPPTHFVSTYRKSTPPLIDSCAPYL